MGYERAMQNLTGRRQTLSALRGARAQIDAAVARGIWAGLNGQWVNRWAS